MTEITPFLRKYDSTFLCPGHIWRGFLMETEISEGRVREKK